MIRRLVLPLLIPLLALAGCGKPGSDDQEEPANRLTLEFPEDPTASLTDFLYGLAYLVEEEPMTLQLRRNGREVSFAVYSSQHPSGGICPVTIVLKKNGSMSMGEEEELEKGSVDKRLELFVSGCQAAEVDPIICIFGEPGVTRDQGLDLLEQVAGYGITRLLVSEETPRTYKSGKPRPKPTPPSSQATPSSPF